MKVKSRMYIRMYVTLDGTTLSTWLCYHFITSKNYVS